MPVTTSTPRGHQTDKARLHRRPALIEGQDRGISLLHSHIRRCVIDGQAPGEATELTDEVMGSVARLLRRG